MTRRELLQSAAAAALTGVTAGYSKEAPMAAPDLILSNGAITTLDRGIPEAQAVAIGDGRILRAGSMAEIMPLAGPKTEVIDLKGRRVIPGLNDSHTHLIRGGLNYNRLVHK